MQWARTYCMELLTSNISAKVRKTTLQGREYLVAPVTLIVPGVLNGSQGSLYYPPEQVAMNPAAWNGMPVVLEHPKAGNGVHTSARDPEVSTNQEIGRLFNARFNGKLGAEAWLDVERTRQLAPEVLARVKAGKAMEVSTGLYTDNVPAANGANFNGVPYTFIAQNYRPDHLAVLVDQRGACSIQDGCGLNVNARAKCSDPEKWAKAKEQAEKSGSEGDDLWALTSHIYEKMGGKIENVDEEDAEGVDGEEECEDPNDPGCKKLQESNPSYQENTQMSTDRKQLIDEIIANCSSCSESDRELLNKLSDDRLKAWRDNLVKGKEQEAVANAVVKGFTDPGGNTHTWNEKTKQWESALKPATVNEGDWLAQAPAGVREDLAFARNEKAKQKGKLIQQLTANIKDEGKRAAQAQRLASRSLEELQADVDLLPEVQSTTPSYIGAAAPVGNTAPLDDPLTPLIP